MAMQQTGTPPNTRRLGIFPYSIRKFVIVLMIILFLVGGIIGITGVWQNWGIVSNTLFMIFAVASVILAILTFWPSTKSNEASAPASPVSPQPTSVQVNNYINVGQQTATQQVPSSSNESGGQEPIPNTNTTHAQPQPSKNMPAGNSPVSPSPLVRRDESPLLNRDDLLEALSACLEAEFVKVVAFSHVPPGILSGYDKPQAIRADELIRWAESEGDQSLEKLNDAFQRAKHGKKPQQVMTENAQSGLGVFVQLKQPEDSHNQQEVFASTVQESQGNASPAGDYSADQPDSSIDDALNLARKYIETAQKFVQKAYAPLTTGKSTIPSQYREAKSSLEKANEAINNLRKLLEGNSSLPESIVSNHIRIISQINIITEQVETYLIPCLNRYTLGNNKPLTDALHEINVLISD